MKSSLVFLIAPVFAVCIPAYAADPAKTGVVIGLADNPDTPALIRAKQAARDHDPDTAERELSSLNRLPASTAAGHLELSHRLIALAEFTARGANPAAVPGITQAAMKHAAAAFSLATDDSERARAKSHEGLIYEKFVGDVPAAITSYQVAAKLNPKDATIAENLGRLVAMEANLRTRLARNAAKKP